MFAGGSKTILSVFSLFWLTGPIFDKELRVSSRRKRTYFLRFAYVALLLLFLVLVWLGEVRYSGSAAYRMSRMARAGKTIIMTIVWFQFCVIQLVAGIMLSTSISDEIYHRTLGALMTTPINSFQIVMGKMFSKLLQIILLLAISLPLLAVVRVFGGVPWSYVISSLCITLTTVIFVGSVSMFFSIFTRRAYVVIIETVLAMGVLFALIPIMTFLILEDGMPDKTLISILFQPNPYVVLAFNTEMMMSPRGGGMPWFSWPLHCGIMLAASAFLLALCVKMVRRVALRQATGQLGTSRNRKTAVGVGSRQDSNGHVRRIKGPAVVWKELSAPMFRGRKILAVSVIAISLLLLLITYAILADNNDLDDTGVQGTYVVVFQIIAMLFTVILPATCITSEKEARSWPLLLATGLSDWQILFGKVIGMLRRCIPAWFAMFGHLILFIVVGYIHPIALIQFPILTAWLIVFFIGTGLYFSSCFKRTTTAVVMNFALAIVIWAIVPILLLLFTLATKSSDDGLEYYMNANPLVQSVIILEATAGRRCAEKSVADLRYDWISSSNSKAVKTTNLLLSYMLVYMSIGAFFAWRAKCRFRRNIF